MIDYLLSSKFGNVLASILIELFGVALVAVAIIAPLSEKFRMPVVFAAVVGVCGLPTMAAGWILLLRAVGRDES